MVQLSRLIARNSSLLAFRNSKQHRVSVFGFAVCNVSGGRPLLLDTHTTVDSHESILRRGVGAISYSI